VGARFRPGSRFFPVGAAQGLVDFLVQSPEIPQETSGRVG
jgi:hypothetical protein